MKSLLETAVISEVTVGSNPLAVIYAVCLYSQQKLRSVLITEKKNLIIVIGLKWIRLLSNHFFYNGIEMHLQGWHSEENPLPHHKLVLTKGNEK